MLHSATPDEIARFSDTAHVDVAPFARQNDTVRWDGRASVAKYHGDDTTGEPYEVLHSGPNLLLTVGATRLLNLLSGAGGNAYNATNTRIAVGSSNAPSLIGHTALTTELGRQLVDATPVVATNTLTFVATFSTSSANGSWQEMAIVDAASAGTMLNRLVFNWGTKTSAVAWVATMVITAS